jgi:lipid-A-disaccharide synthase
VHYVSPTVWAWREGRVKKLRAAVDLLLSIFPFEQDFLRRHGVQTAYVGHTLAANMPMEPDRRAARESLDIAQDVPVLAVLPGSRHGEIERLARPFLATAQICARELPGLQVITPLVNESSELLWRAQRARYAPELEILDCPGQSRQAMAAADVVLTASGTATFEAMLSKRPMVVGYKLNMLTYAIAKWLRLVKLEHVAMANLLAGEELAPEFIQHACEPERLAPAVMRFFREPDRVERIVQRYRELHAELALDTDRLAARAVIRLLHERAVL